jgi:hypothetical protein
MMEPGPRSAALRPACFLMDTVAFPQSTPFNSTDLMLRAC